MRPRPQPSRTLHVAYWEMKSSSSSANRWLSSGSQAPDSALGTRFWIFLRPVRCSVRWQRRLSCASSRQEGKPLDRGQRSVWSGSEPPRPLQLGLVGLARRFTFPVSATSFLLHITSMQAHSTVTLVDPFVNLFLSRGSLSCPLSFNASFREPEALKKFSLDHKQAIEEFIAVQFLFDRQWKAIRVGQAFSVWTDHGPEPHALQRHPWLSRFRRPNATQAYANSKGIKIIGDMPIYVGGHSADVWSNQKLFELGPSGAPANVSGVPPDAFSKTGKSVQYFLYQIRVHVG